MNNKIEAILDLIHSKIKYHQHQKYRADVQSKNYCTQETQNLYASCVKEIDLHTEEINKYEQLLSFAEQVFQTCTQQ